MDNIIVGKEVKDTKVTFVTVTFVTFVTKKNARHHDERLKP